MKTILCPIDFSETSIDALLYAYDIALQCDANLLLLHTYHIPRVVPLMEGFPQPDVDIQISYEREVVDKIDNLINWLNKIHAPASVKCTYKTVPNFAVDEIIKTAYEQAIDLIVLGTKSTKDLKSIFIGTNTVRVIEETHCPVLVVPASACYTKISHILYTSQESQKEEMLFLSNFARTFNASITLVQVQNRTLATSRQAQTMHENAAAAETSIDLFDGVINTNQNIQQTISSFIEDKPFTLLAISAQRRNLLNEILSGNTSGQISYTLRTPVLILQ